MYMTGVLCTSVFWIIYGVLALFGVQSIPEKYKGSGFEKEYKRYYGIGWLLLGIPEFVFWVIVRNMDTSNVMPFVIVIIVIGLPSIIYGFVMERKYKKLLEK